MHTFISKILANTPNKYEMICYVAGLIIIVISAIFNFYYPSNKNFILLAFIGLICFGVGSFIWTLPYLIKIWKWGFGAGKVVIFILNLILYHISTILAQNLVADEIGYPVKDYPITIEILSTLLYVFLAILLIVFICGISMLIAFIVMMVADFIIDVANKILIQNKIKNIKQLYFARILGIALICLMLHHFNHSFFNEIRFLTRYIAYIADYQTINNYPYAIQNKRMILHENAVVSFATIEDGKVIIINKHLKR
ncbi:hypothetical protein [Campylobacter mucosalis]|uniref:Putative membrane protein n=1 Tax=Campylobacter mucosalis CCUG 21559 TaxID=1032067 RepID=A0A6G5QET5_9BACT|nr:hypothetical protein [Campylobacter mucosalis]QCD44205.1 putative membrane protein [Campylobacter mucosalis CCUG 21559]